MCLQEIKATSEHVPRALYEMEGYWSYWHGGKGYSGVGLLVHRDVASVRPTFFHPSFDFEHRAVSATIGSVDVSSIYVPNGGKDFPSKLRFLKALDCYTDQAQRAHRAIMVCGDLNIARTDQDVHQKERKPRAIGQLPEERSLLERIISHGLVDIGRTLDPDNDQLFTWWPPWRQMRQRNIGWRIDYVLASDGLATHAVSSQVRRDIGTSDHAPVVATFNLTDRA